MFLVVVVVGIALIFDFVNGFHDAANSIATVVATRVLKPWQAVIWAAFFNFISFLILPLEVANAIAKIIDPAVVSIGL
ncbi:MAG TPA: inorganic phosphate transporter, partial [Ilumatobacteraceae bacterium]|nr:inorganic phosphate transporter [Ilumatobacteraceae bacterium]